MINILNINTFIYNNFYFCILLSAILVIVTSNPVHSLLYLVISFFNASIILLIFHCEFLSMLFLVVYIGAVIVLFLFIVMMLNVKIVELNSKIIKYLPIGLFIIIIFLMEVFYIINNSLTNESTLLFLNENFHFFQLNLIEFYKIYLTFTNITSISQLLFTKYVYLFILAGMILLVAMLGAILLTLNQNYINKRQDIVKQINTELIDANRYLAIKFTKGSLKKKSKKNIYD